MYLHCHNCNWSQDDFWSWKIKWKQIFDWNSRPFGYNPLSLFLEDIATYWKPRKIKMDSYWAKENGFKSDLIFSWIFIWMSFKDNIKRLFKQKYWTYSKYKKARDFETVECPNCHESKHLDID